MALRGRPIFGPVDMSLPIANQKRHIKTMKFSTTASQQVLTE